MTSIVIILLAGIRGLAGREGGCEEKPAHPALAKTAGSQRGFWVEKEESAWILGHVNEKGGE